MCLFCISSSSPRYSSTNSLVADFASAHLGNDRTQTITRGTTEIVDLRLESQWVNIADVALDPNNLTDLRPGFMVGMVVRNPGMPTVIDWRAEVTWPDQQKETIYPEVRSNTTIHTDK